MMSHPMLSIQLLLLLLTALCTSATVPPPISSTKYDINITINGINKKGSAHSNTYTRVLNIGIMIIIAISLMLFTIFVVYCGIYTTFFNGSSTSDAEPTLPIFNSAQQIKFGMDPAAIDAFPILTYSAATALKIGRENLECAICLSDFEEEEFLRMLPNCCHVFHLECVGSWLQHHVTCPICRDNLAVGAMDRPERRWRRENQSMNFDLHLDPEPGRIGRSHSMDEVVRRDRHRLVLPEHVMRELVEMGRLRRGEEVVVLKGDEGSGGRRFRALSERWTTVILSRVFSKRDGSVQKSEENGNGDSDEKDYGRRRRTENDNSEEV